MLAKSRLFQSLPWCAHMFLAIRRKLKNDDAIFSSRSKSFKISFFEFPRFYRIEKRQQLAVGQNLAEAPNRHFLPVFNVVPDARLFRCFDFFRDCVRRISSGSFVEKLLVFVGEDTVFFRQDVRPPRAQRHLDSLNRVHNDKPQAPVENVEPPDVVEVHSIEESVFVVGRHERVSVGGEPVILAFSQFGFRSLDIAEKEISRY